MTAIAGEWRLGMATNNGTTAPITMAMLSKILPWVIVLATLVGSWTAVNYRLTQIEITVAENRAEIASARVLTSEEQVRLARIETDLQYIRYQMDRLLDEREGKTK